MPASKKCLDDTCRHTVPGRWFMKEEIEAPSDQRKFRDYQIAKGEFT